MLPPKTAASPAGQVDILSSGKRWTERFIGIPGLAWLDSNWAGLAVVAVAFVIAAAVSWRKWPDVIVDFGIQLYIPWRICHGAVLYRDLHYLAGGPFSQYFNALLFKLFGASFRTLIFTNLVITAAMLILIYRRFLTATDRWTATTICLGIVLVFAFNQYLVAGNYNYIAPYSHELFHGLVLSIVAIALLSDWINERRIRHALLAGFCYGLVFLTKPEVFLALTAGVVTAFVLAGVTNGEWRATGSPEEPASYDTHDTSHVRPHAAAFLAAALVPALGFFLYFLTVEGWRVSLSSTASAWAPVLTPLVRDHFYLWCTGFDAPVFHLRQMAIQFVCGALLVALYAGLFNRRTGLGTEFFTWLFLAIPLLAAAACFNWFNCGAALPLWSTAACILLIGNYKKLSSKTEMDFPLLWSLFSLVLLAKLGLFSRVWHYGFALAMPAAVTTIYLLLWLLPLLLAAKFNVALKPFRFTVWLVLLVGFGVLFHISESWYAAKTLAVAPGGDRMLAFAPQLNPSGQAVNQALAWLEKNTPPDATLAVLPEGSAINYLSRRVNPTPCLDWMPNVLIALGQTTMTAAFEKSPPGYICLVTRDTSEFGVGPFGQSSDYGLALMQWIKTNYTPVYMVGHEPLRNGLFGIELLRRLPTNNLPAANNSFMTPKAGLEPTATTPLDSTNK